jgi:beta-lactamase class D
MYKIYCLLACLLLSTIAIAQIPQQFPSGTTGEFVSRDVDTGKYFRVNAEACAKRYSPYSTFKIPNSVIGMETGVVTDPGWSDGWNAVPAEDAASRYT